MPPEQVNGTYPQLATLLISKPKNLYMSDETQEKKRLVFGVDRDEPEEETKFDPANQH